MLRIVQLNKPVYLIDIRQNRRSPCSRLNTVVCNDSYSRKNSDDNYHYQELDYSESTSLTVHAFKFTPPLIKYVNVATKIAYLKGWLHLSRDLDTKQVEAMRKHLADAF